MRTSGRGNGQWERALAGQVLVCDGAMGTMLHAAGAPLDQPLCEWNLTRPRLVADLHAAYIAAGARLVQTNTFNANRMRLGAADNVLEINIAGARLAREAVRASEKPVLVAGSVGPATSPVITRVAVAERAAALREQIAALADWVDVIVLETFGDIESLVHAIDIAYAECDLPVIAQMTFADDGRTPRGELPVEVAAALAEREVAALGANCTVGPAVLQQVVAELAAHCEIPVSVQPNAGVPARLGQRLRYAHNVSYFAEATTQLVGRGASIVGGCCGTTPAHIRAIAQRVAGLQPPPRVPVPVAVTREVTVATPPVRWSYDFALIAALPAPRGQDVERFVEQAAACRAAGADLLMVTYPDVPTARVSPVAAGVVLRQRLGCEVVVPTEAADRSLVGLQAELLGGYALGLSTVLCRTGSARTVGDYPAAGSPWQVDSVRLIAALAGLNDGVDWRGTATPDRTRFVIGGSVNTSAADRAEELDHVTEKARAGAHFLVTETIYELADTYGTLTQLRARGIGLPVVVAVAARHDPVAIDRLGHEQPGVQLTESTLYAARRLGADPLLAKETALSAVRKLRPLIAGVLVSAPQDGDAELVDLVRGLREQR